MHGSKERAPEAACNECSLILAHPPAFDCCSFQMSTFPSYEHDARMCPYLGCAHATCHTGPVCLQPTDNIMSARTKYNRATNRFVPFESPSSTPLLLSVHDVEHLHCSVRGACCQTLAVVVQLSIMLFSGEEHIVRLSDPLRLQ